MTTRTKHPVRTPAPENCEEPSTVTLLARAFRLLEEDQHTAAFSRSTAAVVLPFAQQLLAEFDRGADGNTVTQMLSKASDTLYAGWEEPAHTEPSLAQRAGFYTGFAVCWLLQEHQSGGRVKAPRSGEDGVHTLDSKIPTVCRIDDVLRVLKISRDVFFRQRRVGTFPIPEIEPQIDSSPRFRGTDVRDYINGAFATSRSRRRS